MPGPPETPPEAAAFVTRRCRPKFDPRQELADLPAGACLLVEGGVAETDYPDDACAVYSEKADTHWWMLGKYRFIARLIRRCFGPAPADALAADLGCGGGFGAAHYCPDCAIIGVDRNLHSLEASLRRGMRAGVLADVVDLPFGDGTLDRVFAIDVFEHIADDRRAIAEARRVLLPGGELVVVVPAAPSLFDSHDRAYGHVRRYRKRELAALGRAAGLDQILLTYWGVPYLPTLWLIRKLRGLLFRRREYDDFRSPPRWLNRLLMAELAFESHAVARLPMPFGISLIGLFRRPPADRSATVDV
jgi:SAM-dependent methyltransferase